MAKIKLTLPGLEIPVDGKQVTFTAPCPCSAVDGIQIDGVDYDIVDSSGNVVPFGRDVWREGAVLTVTLDVTNRRAYLQNQNAYTRYEALTPATAELFGLDANAVPDDVFSLIANTRVKISTGSYTGTGTIGESNPNVLTFDFAPKMFVLFTGNATQHIGSGPSAWGYLLVTENNLSASTYGRSYYVSGGQYQWTGATNYFTFSGNTVSWYVPYDPFANVRPEPDCQLNESGTVYQYIAIG